MLTKDEHENIAYAAFQTHAKIAAVKVGRQVPLDDDLVMTWKLDGDLQTLWRGLVLSIIANTFAAQMEREAELSKEPAPNPVGDLAKRLASEMREKGGAAHGIVPGLAIGRETGDDCEGEHKVVTDAIEQHIRGGDDEA